MANPFRKVRGLSDRALQNSLLNHRQNLEGLIGEAIKARRARQVTSWWLVGVTIAVLILAVWK